MQRANKTQNNCAVRQDKNDEPWLSRGAGWGACDQSNCKAHKRNESRVSEPLSKPLFIDAIHCEILVNPTINFSSMCNFIYV